MILREDLDSYAIIKTCLKSVGIWPYDKSRLTILQRVIVLMLIGPYLYMQFLLVFTTQFSITLFIRVISSCCSFSIIFLGYIFYIFRIPLMLNLDVQLNKDRKMFHSKAENDILQDNASSNGIILFLCSLYCILGFIGFIFMQFLPNILDIIVPLNEPRQHSLLLPARYVFVSQNKYFYTKVLHELVVVAVAGTVCYAIAAQILLFLSHCIGMLKVARYQVQYFVENIVSHVPESDQERAICKVIMRAVIVHRAALEFSKTLVSTFNEIICCAYVVIVIAISFNLYGLIDALMVLKDTGSSIIYLAFFIGYFLFVVATTYLAQQFNDHNIELFKVIYVGVVCVSAVFLFYAILSLIFLNQVFYQNFLSLNHFFYVLNAITRYGTSWYSLPVSSQKLILFLLQHGSRSYYIKIGFIFEGKLENVAMALNASLSYVAVMYNFFNQ